MEAYGQQPKQVVDINSVPSNIFTMEYIIQNNKKINEQVQNSLKSANEKYKEAADRSRRIQNFEVDEFVMVHLHKDICPAGSFYTLSMLQPKQRLPITLHLL